MSNKATTKTTEKAVIAKTKEAKTEKTEPNKTEIVLKMVAAGKTRKVILDKLVSLDENISRKSNAGLVSHIFKAHDLLGKVESGAKKGPAKKEVKVTAKSA